MSKLNFFDVILMDGANTKRLSELGDFHRLVATQYILATNLDQDYVFSWLDTNVLFVMPYKADGRAMTENVRGPLNEFLAKHGAQQVPAPLLN